MAVILRTTFSNPCHWITIVVIRFEVYSQGSVSAASLNLNQWFSHLLRQVCLWPHWFRANWEKYFWRTWMALGNILWILFCTALFNHRQFRLLIAPLLVKQPWNIRAVISLKQLSLNMTVIQEIISNMYAYVMGFIVRMETTCLQQPLLHRQNYFTGCHVIVVDVELTAGLTLFFFSSNSPASIHM